MENLKGEQLTIIGEPDKEERQEKAVDLLVRGITSGTEFAIEHTRIEVYPSQIRDNHLYREYLRPFEDRLSGALPTPGHYELRAPIAIFEEVRKKEWEGILDALEKWVRGKAPILKIRSLREPGKHLIRETPPGVPLEVTLHRFRGIDGAFRFVALIGDDVEGKRKPRIRTALEKKCPKLQEAREGGSITVLILESDDFQMSNYGVIAEAVEEGFSQRDDIPDEVYLVETVMERRTIWVLKEGQDRFLDIEGYGPHYVDEL